MKRPRSIADQYSFPFFFSLSICLIMHNSKENEYTSYLSNESFSLIIIFKDQMKLYNPLRSRRAKVYRILGIITSIVSGLIWIATISVLFLRWGLDDFIRYDSDDGDIVYISNVGAVHKWGFILGTSTTGVPFFLTSLFTKLYYDLRNKRRSKRILSTLFVLSVFISAVSLILLSILDSVNHKNAHYTFVGLFIAFMLISAILLIIYRYNRNEVNWVLLLRSLLIGMFIVLIITFIVLGRIGQRDNRSNLKSVAAAIEWSLAILFVIYLFLFAFDFIFYTEIQNL